MKKYLMLFCLVMGCLTYSFAQDDGLVTSQLSVDLNQDHIKRYLEAFDDGLAEARSGQFTSPDAIAAYSGIDIFKNPTIAERITNANNGAREIFSIRFMTGLNNVIKKKDQYTSVHDIRNEFVKIALLGGWSTHEAESLALLDLSAQKMQVEMDRTSTGSLIERTIRIPGVDFSAFIEEELVITPTYSQKVDGLIEVLTCVFGTIGSALIGAFNGAGVGAQIGAIFGPAGTSAGATVGAVIGLGSGVVKGIKRFC